MDVHIIDCNGRELNGSDIRKLKIWNTTINSACKRIKMMEKHERVGESDGIAK